MGLDKKILINSFVEKNGLIGHEITSYNDFIGNGLQRIIDEIGVITPDIENFEIRLEKIKVGKPSVKEANGQVRPIVPNEARLRDLTYSAPIFLEMTPIRNEQKNETKNW